MPFDQSITSLLPRHGGGDSAQHCAAMTNWPHTIQCLSSDDMISLGIKPSATAGVGLWFLFLGSWTLIPRS